MITLPPDIEQKIILLAQEANMTVNNYLASIVSQLPEPKKGQDAISAKLAAWQMEDGSELLPDTSIGELFARFKEEDAESTEAERKEEYRLWLDIEKALQESRGLIL